MKKLLAILLAALMALSCTLALAEGGDIEEPAASSGVIITSELSVDREVLAEDLALMGMPVELTGFVDTIAAILSEVGETLVVSGNGLDYQLTLKGSELLGLSAVMDENGISLASNLIPEHVLTIPADMLGTLLAQAQGSEFDSQAMLEAITPYLGQYMMSVMGAVTPGEPEQGEFELNGATFNYRISSNVDVATISAATITLVQQIAADETVMSALQSVPGLNLSMDSLENADVSNAEVPTVDVMIYSNVDEQGMPINDTSAVEFNVCAPDDETHIIAYGYVLVNGQKMNADIVFVDSNTELAWSFLPGDNGGEIRIDVTAAGLYFGADFNFTAGDAVTLATDVFIINDEKPLLSSYSEILPGDGVPVTIDTTGKTVVSVADLSGEGSEEAVGELTNDLLSNGLGGLITSAMSAMPDEVTALVGMFMGGGMSSGETPAA